MTAQEIRTSLNSILICSYRRKRRDVIRWMPAERDPVLMVRWGRRAFYVEENANTDKEEMQKT